MNEAELTMYAFVVLLSLFSTTNFVTAAQFGHPNVRHRVTQYHNQKQKQQLKTSSNLKNGVLLLHPHMSLIPSLSPSINYDSSYIQNKHYYPSDYTTTAASDFSNPPTSASETLLNIRLLPTNDLKTTSPLSTDPTLSNVNYLEVKFSVTGNFHNNSIENERISSGNDSLYNEAIITGVSSCLCSYLPYLHMISSQAEGKDKQSNLCDSYLSSTEHLHHHVNDTNINDAIIDERFEAFVAIEADYTTMLQYEWISTSSLNYYLNRVRYTIEKLRKNEDLAMLQLSVSNATISCIQSGNLVNFLSNIDVRITEVSKEGEEKVTFTLLGTDDEVDVLPTNDDDNNNGAIEVMDNEVDVEQEKDNTNGTVVAGTYGQLNASSMHPLRIAGIVLLLITVFLSSLLFLLANKRKRKKEIEKDRSMNVTGALDTEEGVNQLLDIKPSTLNTYFKQ